MVPIMKVKKTEKYLVNKKFTCSFTGHRPHLLPAHGKADDETVISIKKRISSRIEYLIKTGVTEFISGMAQGFDSWCACEVLKLKKIYPHIRLIGAVPYKDQALKWNLDEQLEYNKLLGLCDDVYLVSEDFFKGCYQKRNRFMVDNSGFIIAFCNAEKGGTYQTLKYASEKGLITLNIAVWYGSKN